MTVVIKIEDVEAVQFHQVMTAGRTSPLLLTCEKSDGSIIEAVVKFATGQHCTTSALCAELIASQLAADLGMPTPRPLLVRWDQVFTNSLVDKEARGVVSASAPPAFGSTFTTDGFASWSTDRKLIGDSMRQMALATFFFDAMIGNSDRGSMKPNILVRGDSLRLIDHEMAFRDYMLIVKPIPPWGLGGLNGMVTPGVHIFATQLINNAGKLNFDPIRAAWMALSDPQIEAYGGILPSGWIAGHSLPAFAIERIKACRDRIDECVTECRRVLNV